MCHRKGDRISTSNMRKPIISWEFSTLPGTAAVHNPLSWLFLLQQRERWNSTCETQEHILPHFPAPGSGGLQCPFFADPKILPYLSLNFNVFMSYKCEWCHRQEQTKTGGCPAGHNRNQFKISALQCYLRYLICSCWWHSLNFCPSWKQGKSSSTDLEKRGGPHIYGECLSQSLCDSSAFDMNEGGG